LQNSLREMQGIWISYVNKECFGRPRKPPGESWRTNTQKMPKLASD